MYRVVKVGSKYVSTFGALVDRQSDAMRIDGSHVARFVPLTKGGERSGRYVVKVGAEYIASEDVAADTDEDLTSSQAHAFIVPATDERDPTSGARLAPRFVKINTR